MRTCVNHPDTRMAARGLCWNCYMRAYNADALAGLPQIYPIDSDQFRPVVARCYLCSTTVTLEYDHKHRLVLPDAKGPTARGLEDGPTRGLLCRPCNRMLGHIERVGLETVVGYLTASPIGADYREVRREQKRLAHRRMKLRRVAGG